MKILPIFLVLILVSQLNIVFAAEGNVSNTSNTDLEKDLNTLKNKKVNSFPVDNFGKITGVNFRNLGNESYEISFIVNKPFMANLRMLNYPYRLVMDIDKPYRWQVPVADVKKVPLTIVQGIRYGRQENGTFRVVLDLSKNFVIKKTTMSTISNNSYQVVITLNKSSNIASPVTLSNNLVFVDNTNLLKEMSIDSESQDKASVASLKSDEQKLREYLNSVAYPKPHMESTKKSIVVMIDPGHGGKDPGASTDDNELEEKNIVLNVSKLLAADLEQNKEISVVLSRRDDYYLPLKDRVMWAKFLGVNLFVSIHADTADNYKDSSGMSVYTLSEVSSDAQAQLLANDANKSDLIAGVGISHETEEVNQVLARLSQRLKQNDSVLLAKSIIHYSSKQLRILNNPVRSANFAVLKVPNTPSVLVELGFLSNIKDLAEFKDESYADKSAQSLSLGIQYYLWDKGLLSSFPSSAYYKTSPILTAKKN
ncbi:N-acetylmuramoyl-L-alanine amidase [Candidatus Hepatincola sp. Pdp]